MRIFLLRTCQETYVVCSNVQEDFLRCIIEFYNFLHTGLRALSLGFQDFRICSDVICLLQSYIFLSSGTHSKHTINNAMILWLECLHNKEKMPQPKIFHVQGTTKNFHLTYFQPDYIGCSYMSFFPSCRYILLTLFFTHGIGRLEI